MKVQGSPIRLPSLCGGTEVNSLPLNYSERRSLGYKSRNEIPDHWTLTYWVSVKKVIGVYRLVYFRRLRVGCPSRERSEPHTGNVVHPSLSSLLVCLFLVGDVRCDSVLMFITPLLGSSLTFLRLSLRTVKPRHINRSF